MTEQEKKWQIIYDLLNTETKPKRISEKSGISYFGCPYLYSGKLKHFSAAVSLCLPQLSLVYLGIKKIQPGKSFLKFDCCFKKVFKNYEDLIQIMTSLFSCLSIWEVSLWPPSSPDLNSLDYSIWGILENKTNTTSHPNISLLKTATEEEWNKMSEEFILKACKLFWRQDNTIIE